MANMIFNAVEDIDAEVATVKLVRKKHTLVARSLWQDLCNLGHARERWQLDGLDQAALMMLETVEAAPMASAAYRKLGERLRSLSRPARRSGLARTYGLSPDYQGNNREPACPHCAAIASNRPRA